MKNLQIVDAETGKQLGVNEDGELRIRGPARAIGYLNDEEATKQTFDSDGWLHTGITRYKYLNLQNRKL